MHSFLRHLKKFHSKSNAALTTEASSVSREECDTYVEPNSDESLNYNNFCTDGKDFQEVMIVLLLPLLII